MGKAFGLLAALALLTINGIAPALAKDSGDIAEIRKAWAACQEQLSQAPDAWVGWRHDFFNGYGDNFQFYDNRNTGLPTVLVRDIMTDAIAYETVTSCYRPDGTLAFMFTSTNSPNMAGDEGENGPWVTREGRIYVDAKGKVIRTLGQIVDAEGKVLVEGVDNDKVMLARGCSPVMLHLTADSVESEYFNVLGDIEGNHPPATGEDYDWCAVVAQ